MAEAPPNLNEILTHCEVTIDELCKPCSFRDTADIAGFLGSWRDIAPHLGLDESDIIAIEDDGKDTAEKKRLALQRWKSKFGYKATFKWLVEALVKINMAACAERVCECVKARYRDALRNQLSISLPTTSEVGSGNYQVVMDSRREPRVQLLAAIPSSPTGPLTEYEIFDLSGDFGALIAKLLPLLATAVNADTLKVYLTSFYHPVRRLPYVDESLYQHLASTEEILKILLKERYFHPLQVGLLRRIVKEYGCAECNRLLEEYESKIPKDTSLKRSCNELSRDEIASSSSTKELEVKSREDSITLNKVEVIQEELEEASGVSRDMFIYANHKEGSTLLTFLIPASMEEALVDIGKSEKHLSKLAAVGILSIEIGQVTINVGAYLVQRKADQGSASEELTTLKPSATEKPPGPSETHHGDTASGTVPAVERTPSPPRSAEEGGVAADIASSQRKAHTQTKISLNEPFSPSHQSQAQEQDSSTKLEDELAPFVLRNVEGLGTSDKTGAGSYGSVCEVTVDGIRCIAKRLHDVFVSQNVSAQKREAIRKTFREECALLSRLNHPNILQFMGVHYGQSTSDISLIMECLHTDLRRLIDSHPNIPLSVKLSILLDASHGLLYLHTRDPPIVHRDLTASNILLTDDLHAKIGNLGMSKLFDLHTQAATAQSKAPGALNYMPPEALKECPIYDVKGDVFSFGHLSLCTALQEFPEVLEMGVKPEMLKEGSVQIVKRKGAIDKMGSGHCLHPLVLQCLSDDPAKRPTTADLNATLRRLSQKHPRSLADLLKATEVPHYSPGEESKDELGEEPKDELGEEPKDVLGVEPKDELVLGEEPKEELGVEPKEELNKEEVNRELGPSISVHQVTAFSHEKDDDGDMKKPEWEHTSDSTRPTDDSCNIAPGPHWDFFDCHWSASGKREAFLLVSTGEAAPDGNPDVIPLQGAGELTEEDRRKLDSQGVPPDCRDDVSIVRARTRLDPDLELSREEVSTTGRELSRGYVLRQLEEFLDSVDLSMPGAVIHYIGHGKKRTGDWCFSDGFITFRDIIHLYNTTKIKGRVLAIVSNCSHSGSWVWECCRYLDEQGVRACAHSAAEKGILLKVAASCRPSEMASSRAFSVGGMINIKNTKTLGYWSDNKELHESQHALGFDFTWLYCGKTPQEPCTCTSPKYTWMKKYQGLRGLLYVVRGTDRGRPAWHYVVLRDDEETRREFLKKVASGTVDVADYGEVVKSGFGKDPPQEVIDELDKQY